jgi:Flp pilus assembly protein TadD
VCLLAACQTTGGLGASDEGSLAPPGIDTRQEGVDPLLVGHRLMEAGEYELALRSYTRAASERGATVDVLSGIGSANLRLGRLGQAETILRRAIEQDETFPPAWNNLGVVLMETNRYGEASRVFQTAFALDNGASVEIQENLRLALAKLENPSYSADDTNFALVWTGGGTYSLAPLPEAGIEQ